MATFIVEKQIANISMLQLLANDKHEAKICLWLRAMFCRKDQFEGGELH